MKPSSNFFTICAGFLISLFCIFAINVKNTNATNINSFLEHKITSAQISNANGQYLDATTNYHTGASFTTTSQSSFVGGKIQNLTINIDQCIPAYSVFYLTGYYYSGSSVVHDFRGFQSSPNFIILDAQVTDILSTDTSAPQGLQFSYVLYTGQSSVCSLLFGNNAMFDYTTGYSYFFVSNIISARMSTDPSSNQIDAIISNLGDIKSQLQNISQSSGAEALNEMNEREEQDRDNLEQQSSDAQDGADDSQEQAQSTGTTLLAAFTAFVNALQNASPSNCNIDMDLGNLDLGNVNLCQLSPPPGFSAIASIFMILFCVPLSIATARKVISLFRSFQG